MLKIRAFLTRCHHFALWDLICCCCWGAITMSRRKKHLQISIISKYSFDKVVLVIEKVCFDKRFCIYDRWITWTSLNSPASDERLQHKVLSFNFVRELCIWKISLHTFLLFPLSFNFCSDSFFSFCYIFSFFDCANKKVLIHKRVKWDIYSVQHYFKQRWNG